MRQTVGILGTPIDILDTEAVLTRLDQFIQEGRFHQVATANTDFLINALADPELRHILRNADLVMPDGMPVVWAARLVRSALPERVTGADIVPELARLAAEKGYGVYMLGSSPEVACRAQERLQADYPGLKILGCVSPPVRDLIEMDTDEIIADIVAKRPEILLVAFGNPKQEKWIHMNRERLADVPVCIGVGGTFDFLAGKVRRAPVWMQRGGMEWCHRLVQEPRRLWKRYVRDISQFARYLVRQWWAVQCGRLSGASEIKAVEIGDHTILSIVGDFDSRMIECFQKTANEALNSGRHLILDLQRVTGFDGAMLGTLINLSKRAAYKKRQLRLVALSPAMRRALSRSQVHEELFQIADTVAEAFANSRPVGMCWQLHRGKDEAIVTISGAAEAIAAQNLEKACLRLLAAGKTVTLDMRNLTYSDSHLLGSLYRLSHSARPSGPAVRIVPGEILGQAIKRAKMTDKLDLVTPSDVSDQFAEEDLPDRQEDISQIDATPIYAQGAS